MPVVSSIRWAWGLGAIKAAFPLASPTACLTLRLTVAATAEGQTSMPSAFLGVGPSGPAGDGEGHAPALSIAQ